MLLNHKNFKKTVGFFDKNKVIEIFCNKNLHSVCESFILTQIFKKELLKYQIEFINTKSSIFFKIEEKEYHLYYNNQSTTNDSGDSYDDDGKNIIVGGASNINNITTNNTNNNYNTTNIINNNPISVESYCDCEDINMKIINLLFFVIKSMNLVKTETLWPIIISFTYYRKFLYFSNDNFCIKCQNLIRDLTLATKTLNCKFDGIFHINRNKMDFLTTSKLILAIKNDLNFIFDKKLFSNTKFSDKKINEFLAKNGISIMSANNLFINLELETKNLINKTFGKELKFVQKFGHDLEITSLEHAFLILFFLYKEKEMYSYMCLEKRKLLDLEKSCKFYYKIITLFKEGVLNNMLLEDIMIFKIKDTFYEDANLNILADILVCIFKIYLEQREMIDHKILLSFNLQSDFLLLFSENLDFDILKENKVSYNCIKIQSKDFDFTMKMLLSKIRK